MLMKKTLLTLIAMIVCVCTINAATTATFTFSVTNNYGLPNGKGNNDYLKDNIKTTDNDGVILSFSKVGTGNGFRLWDNELRLMKTQLNTGSATITISVPTNSIVTAISIASEKMSTVKIGGSAITYDETNKTYSWTGKETEPAIVFTATATKKITKLTVTYEAYDPTDTRADAEIKFPEASYTIDEGASFTAPEPTKATTAALAYTSSNRGVATVDETTGAVTIVAPGTTTITATAKANTEFKEGEASYTLTVLKVVNSIAETMAVTDNTLKLRINYPLTVAYKNGSNNFVTDGTDFIQIYGSSQPSYTSGDVIPAGWIGNYTLYQNVTPEIENPAGMESATENNGFTPAKVSEISESDINKVLTLENVVFAAATPADRTNFTGKIKDTEIEFRNNYTVASVEAGTYNVSGVVSVFGTSTQLYPISYEKVDDTTGIADIVADENAPVEYFNPQGIRVDNPENGLYIRRQGNKVTKVIVK